MIDFALHEGAMQYKDKQKWNFDERYRQSFYMDFNADFWRNSEHSEKFKIFGRFYNQDFIVLMQLNLHQLKLYVYSLKDRKMTRGPVRTQVIHGTFHSSLSLILDFVVVHISTYNHCHRFDHLNRTRSYIYLCKHISVICIRHPTPLSNMVHFHTDTIPC